MSKPTYIHGTTPSEQDRLAKLGDLTNAAFLGFLEYGPHSIVLDVGSGLGELARQLALRIPQGQIWGVERSQDQLSKVTADLPNLQFQQADANALPFEDGRFDVVYCRYLLEHVAKPTQVLREMHRVLKPGGKVFVQENDIFANTLYPDCPHFDRLWQTFAELQQRFGGDALIGKKLLALLSETGFTQIRLSIAPEVHYSGVPTFVPWIENLMGNVRASEKDLINLGLASSEDFRRAIDELRQLLNNPVGSAFFYWNRASGIK